MPAGALRRNSTGISTRSRGCRPDQGLAFQRKVWAALRRIPPGRTMGYGELAAWIGAPRASRAVGRANGANPVALVVPCHPVVGTDGALTGYGGGLSRKAWLLDHERRSCPPACRAEFAFQG